MVSKKRMNAFENIETTVGGGDQKNGEKINKVLIETSGRRIVFCRVNIEHLVDNINKSRN